MVWGRIRLALEAGELELARHLGTWLPTSERSWLDYGLEVLARPALVLEPLPEPARADGQASTPPSARANAQNRARPSAPAGADPVPSPLAAAILAMGIVKLAGVKPEEAAAALESRRAALEPDPFAWDRAHAAVGQALTPIDGPRGLALWDRMAAHDNNLEAQERRLRAAISQRDWARVAEWVQRMPDQMEKRDRWLYWQGRAEAALGRDAAARESFAAAAGQRSLWGLLAADRLELPYPLESRPVPAEPERLRRLATAPALERIRELQRLGRDADMRREWRTLTRDLDAPDLRAAASLAAGLGWHDQAIFTLARTDYWDDLELRFPLAYRDLVADQAWQTGLPEDWIYGVIRQESVFNPTVASQAGALGLMQLCPVPPRNWRSRPVSRRRGAAPSWNRNATSIWGALISRGCGTASATRPWPPPPITPGPTGWPAGSPRPAPRRTSGLSPFPSPRPGVMSSGSWPTASSTGPVWGWSRCACPSSCRQYRGAEPDGTAPPLPESRATPLPSAGDGHLPYAKTTQVVAMYFTPASRRAARCSWVQNGGKRTRVPRWGLMLTSW